VQLSVQLPMHGEGNVAQHRCMCCSTAAEGLAAGGESTGGHGALPVKLHGANGYSAG
jgi:hypothetical protein